MSRGRSFDTIVRGDAADPVDEPRGSRLDAWWGRVLCTPARARLWYWGGPALVLVLAAVLRLWRLGDPHSLVFDETFYVKDADSIMHLGYEGSWPDNVDARFAAGGTSLFTSAAEFVAHPPLGKWIMAGGLALFGPDSSVGWRASTAVAGIIAVAVVMLLARRMLRSTVLAVLAGLLMAVDGSAIVMSRVSLLDNLLMLVALLGFWCILNDRVWHRRRLDRLLAARRRRSSPAWGPVTWWRPWLLTAAICFGAAAGIKWSGFYFLAFFGVYTVIADALARRHAGLPFWISASVLKQGPVNALLLVPLGLAVYVGTWSGWIATSGGWARQWAAQAGHAATGALAWVPLWAQSLWHYQVQMYEFNVNLHVSHPYQANPLTWPLMLRPTNMYYLGTARGQDGCPWQQCSAQITDIANPILWWVAGVACLYLIYRLARYREWQVGLILAGVAAGYLPWLLYLDRTVFQFYTIAYLPYLVLAVTVVDGLVLGRRDDPTPRRARGILFVAAFVAVVLLVSAFFYPLWTAMRIPYWFWHLHIWLPGWW